MSLVVDNLDHDIAAALVLDLAILAHFLNESQRVHIRIPRQDIGELARHGPSIDRQHVDATAEVSASLELLLQRAQNKAEPLSLPADDIVGRDVENDG